MIDEQIGNFMFPNFAAAVTPNDSTDLAKGGILYIGGAGAVAVITMGGQTVTFAAVPVGTILPIRVARVLSTGTTATNILVLASKY